MQDEQKVPPEDYEKPMGKGGDLPPLPLLPDREWLGARIVSVELRYAMFNNAIQYVCTKDFDEAEGKEIDVPVLDDDGNKIPRKEFNIKFELHDYSIPDAKKPTQRNVWLSIGAALGDKAHLPQFLLNVLGPDFQAELPKDVVSALRGLEVKLQLKNKPNKKDPTKPPYQNVIYDAVLALEKEPGTAAPGPVKEKDVAPADPDSVNCSCGEKADGKRTEVNGQIMDICKVCEKVIVAWDE